MLRQSGRNRVTRGRPARADGPASRGGEGDRTPDLVNAIHALSQLSYAPINIGSPRVGRRQQRKLVRAPGGVKQNAPPL